jgi:capsular exopolysaccharide synthesis family protein
MANPNIINTDIIEVNLQDISKKVSKHFWKILIAMLLCGSAAFVFSKTQTPIYQATSRILVEGELPKILKVENTVVPDYPDPTTYLDSQVEVLKSHAIINLVYNELGSYEPIVRRGKPADKLKPMGDVERKDALLSQVKIEPLRLTQIIAIKVKDPDPKLAAHIANTWLKSYLLFSFVNQLMERRSGLQADMTQELEFYKAGHPIIKGIERQIMAIDQKIKDEKERISRQGNASDTSTDLGGSMTNIKILDWAQVPFRPVWPPKNIIVFVGILIGLVIGLALGYFFDSFDKTINSLIEIEQVLQLSCLATIPYFKDRKFKGMDPAHISANVPRSGVAESFRCLRTGILFSNPDHPKKTFAVTSSFPMEGKSTVAVNLATVFAQANERTLLVDTDMRKSSLHKIFKVDNTIGIADILTFDKEDIKSFILKTETPGLDLLVCGQTPLNSSELLGSENMEKLIAKLSLMYDRIVFDTPPVLAATDAVILSAKVDSTLLVVRAGVTHAQAVLRSQKLLQSVRPAQLQAVLNMVRFDAFGPGFYNYYYENKEQKVPQIPSISYEKVSH